MNQSTMGTSTMPASSSARVSASASASVSASASASASASVSASASASVSASVSVTPVPSQNTTAQFSLELTEKSWNANLLDKTSNEYKKLRDDLSDALESSLNSSIVFVNIVGFSPGSVIAAFTMTTSNSHFPSARKTLEEKLKKGKLGNFSVVPTLISENTFEVMFKVNETCEPDFLDKSSKTFKSFRSKVEKAVRNESTMSMKITGVTLKRVECPEDKSYTSVTLLVQIDQPKSQSPDEALKDLKTNAINGKVGALSVDPDSWKAFKYGNKRLFVASLKLIGANDTMEKLHKAVDELMANQSDYLYNTVEIENGAAIIKVSMKPTASSYPNEALEPLRKAANKGKIGSVDVESNSYNAWMESPLSAKVYRVQLDYAMSKCHQNTISDSEVEDDVSKYIEEKFKNSNTYKNVTSVEVLYCKEKAARVQVLIHMDPSVPDNPAKSLITLMNCANPNNKGKTFDVLLLTPTTAGYSKVTTFYCNEKTTSTSPTPTTVLPEKLPKLYVKVRLDMTWRKFCQENLDQKLKKKIAENLYGKNGQRVSAEQIVFFNKEKRCKDPMKQDEQVDLWFYVSATPGSNKVSKCLTVKAYKVLKMFFDNGNTDKLGADFDGKVGQLCQISACSLSTGPAFDPTCKR